MYFAFEYRLPVLFFVLSVLKGWYAMTDSNAPLWCKSQPKIHTFVAKVSDLVADDARRHLWFKFLARYPDAVKAGDDARAEWNMKKRRYFEGDIFKRGNASHRDETVIPDGLYWTTYRRKVDAAQLDVAHERYASSLSPNVEPL